MTAVLLLALACWAMRSLFVLAVPADRLPARLQHGLAQLAPAVLAALVVAELAGSVQEADATTGLVLVGSMVLAALAVRRTGSLGAAGFLSAGLRKRRISVQCGEPTVSAITGWQQIPSYSITSSARASTVGGISRPSALAVLRLITSSNFIGCSTGRSAGFAPVRMRST